MLMLCSFVLTAGAKSSPVATEYADKPTPTTSGNSSQQSPKTGDPLFLIICMGAAAIGAGALAVKKIKE